MKDKLLVLAVIVALVLGGLSFVKDDVQIGAISPFSPTPEINLGGLRLVGVEKALATATSTVCALQSPSATSTLIAGGVKFTLASTSAVVLDITNATTQYASSTAQIGTAFSLGASAKAMIVASTTDNDATFAPNRWFVAKFYDANNGAGNAAVGRCYAVFAVPQ